MKKTGIAVDDFNPSLSAACQHWGIRKSCDKKNVQTRKRFQIHTPTARAIQLNRVNDWKNSNGKISEQQKSSKFFISSFLKWRERFERFLLKLDKRATVRNIVWLIDDCQVLMFKLNIHWFYCSLINNQVKMWSFFFSTCESFLYKHEKFLRENRQLTPSIPCPYQKLSRVVERYLIGWR